MNETKLPLRLSLQQIILQIRNGTPRKQYSPNAIYVGMGFLMILAVILASTTIFICRKSQSEKETKPYRDLFEISFAKPDPVAKPKHMYF